MGIISALGDGWRAFYSGIFKKEELKFPYKWALVRLSRVAKEKGIDDDYNREIVMIENNKETKIYPYSNHLVNILREQGIPVEYEPEEAEEEIEFDEVASFGESRIST